MSSLLRTALKAKPHRSLLQTHSRAISASLPRSAFLKRGPTYATASSVSPPRQDASTSKPKVSLSRSSSMFIQTETTPNEDSLKFIPGVDVMGDGTAEFLDTRSALPSPLAIRLMGVEGVKAVFYGPDFVTVSKDSENPWAVIKPEIYSILMEFFSSGQALFRSEEERDNAGPQDTKILDTDSETVAMIKELLETRVRPAIMEDGGDIEYRGFDEGGDALVKVKLKGSCRGCDSSAVTLKSGIERMLMHYIPEVKGVKQVLDQDEEIALKEFDKLEKRLEGKPPKSTMAQYMSV
ncbi:HIRA-interacting protein 5 [Mycena rebaudengoi]|nr:HIRA-interacting protein 5 [Mycena rebaudengoi]